MQPATEILWITKSTTQKIGPTKYSREKFWTHEYPRGKLLEPRNTLEKNFWAHETPTKARRCYTKKAVLRNLKKFTEKHQYQSLFFNKFASITPATSLKRHLEDSSIGVFLRIWRKLLQNSFSIEHLWTYASGFTSKVVVRTPYYKETDWKLQFLFLRLVPWCGHCYMNFQTHHVPCRG